MIKKIITITSIICILSVNNIFAQSIEDYVKDLSRVKDDLSLIYTAMAAYEPYSKESILKQLEYDKTILKNVIKNVEFNYNKQTVLSIKRQYNLVTNITTLYDLAINNLSLYLSDNNISNFLSSVSLYQKATCFLTELKNSIK